MQHAMSKGSNGILRLVFALIACVLYKCAPNSGNNKALLAVTALTIMSKLLLLLLLLLLHEVANHADAFFDNCLHTVFTDNI